MTIHGHNKNFKKVEVKKEMNKLEACKYLDQAMGMEGVDENNWNTLFGIKSRLCFCNEENDEDADSLEEVWYSLRNHLADPVLNLNLLNVVYAIRNNCWESCKGADWHCECRNCPWDGEKIEYDDEIKNIMRRRDDNEPVSEKSAPEKSEDRELTLEDLFPSEWEPIDHNERNASEASMDDEEEDTDPDTLFLGEMQEYEDADALFSFEEGESGREGLSVIPEFI